jgi:riboflavin kinase/FMN adenylyltransferase
MDVVAGIDRLGPEHGRLFVVVGVFDGLHRGHRYLLTRLRRAAAAHGARPAVITFDAHPDEIVVGAAPPLLCDPEERLARLAAAGVELTVVQHFDSALRRTEYDAFVARIRERIELAGLLMTPDAAFGHERRGTPAALAALGQELGFSVVVVPSFEIDGRPVRSSSIRAAIADGDLATARALTGRPIAVTGQVTDRRMTFPVPVALPPDGRYRVGMEPAWTAVGRVAAPRPGLAGIVDGLLRLDRPGVVPRSSRTRVAFVARLPEGGRPAILGRSQK